MEEFRRRRAEDERRERQEREWWRRFEDEMRRRRPPPNPDNQNTRPTGDETTPQPLDADGRYPLVEGNFIASMAGTPTVFADQ